LEVTVFLLAHCGGGQDKPGYLGPSAERPGSNFSEFCPQKIRRPVVFLALLYFRTGDNFCSFSHYQLTQSERADSRVYTIFF